MLVNAPNLSLVYSGFKSIYTDAYDAAPADAMKIAMEVPSSAAEETYGWLGQFPQLREWIGPRVVQNLSAHAFTIKNRKFASTVSVSRDHISDDRLGVFKPMFSEMGWLARQHPEELVFGLLAAGFSTTCFDGQNYFDTDHPVENADGIEESVSNMQDGAETPWFLIDTSRMMKPIIWQTREKYEFQAMDRSTDEHVFINDEYLYGVRARVNAGFGLWQLAFGSKLELNAANYAAARASMMGYRSNGGRVLGIRPTMLVVPPSLESDARKILKSEHAAGGETNEWKDSAEMIVTPFVGA